MMVRNICVFSICNIKYVFYYNSDLDFRFSTPMMYEVDEGDNVTIGLSFSGNPGDYQPVILLSINNGMATGSHT